MWKHYVADNGVWYWFYQQLPNGWYACICDDSQGYEPPRQTNYQIFAAADFKGNAGGVVLTLNQVAGQPCDTFEDAKRAALVLAMAQPDLKAGKQHGK